jgi:hypothetical protein
VANHSTNTVSVLLGNGDGTFGANADFAAGPGPYSVAIEDLDADGKPDLTVTNASASTVSVLLGNGDGTLSAKTDYDTGASPQSVAIRDLNGDRKPDLVVANRNPGTVSVLLNIGPGAPSVLSARAFLVGDRVIPIGVGPPALCARLEPMDGSFELSDVDLSTLSMASDGTGSVGRISAIVSKGSRSADMDHNGTGEIPACFARADLAQLLGSIRGRHDVEVAIEGRLGTGRAFHAALPLTVIGRPPNAHRPAVTTWPNPMNPRGVLRFTTSAPGLVTARVFDLSGRLVRTITPSEFLEAGDHAMVIDDRGGTLATGVYFYRLETPDGVSRGRFVVAK